MERVLLVVTPWYPTREHPADGVFIQELTTAGSAWGRPLVLHVEGTARQGEGRRLRREEDAELTRGVPVYRLRYPVLPIPRLSYPLYLRSVHWAFRRLVARERRPTLIHAHVYNTALPAALIGRFYRIPVVYTEHFRGHLAGTLSRTERIKAGIATRGARVVMPVSHALETAMRREGLRGNFQVVPNVVDTDLFRPRDDHSVNPTERRILFVGALIPRKGVNDLLDAVAAMRTRCVVDLVGDGAGRSEYEPLAAELGIADRVRFHGMVPKAELCRMMQASSMLVVPSYVETFSVVAAEALAVGTPVVATRSGGPEEFVTPDVGVLVPPGDVRRLRDAMDSVLASNGFDRDRIAAYARERFGMDVISRKLASIYQSAVSG